VLYEPPKPAEAILIATGSEVSVALDAAQLLETDGLPVRVVSLPSWELFAAQPRSYQDEVLPPSIRARVAVEAASPMGWDRWVSDEGESVTINRFGASAPGERILQEFGFTADNVAAVVRRVVARRAR
jgi:transketolase